MKNNNTNVIREKQTTIEQRIFFVLKKHKIRDACIELVSNAALSTGAYNFTIEAFNYP